MTGFVVMVAGWVLLLALMAWSADRIEDRERRFREERRREPIYWRQPRARR